MLIYYSFMILTITAGYHRLFAHRAYKAHWFVEWFFCIFGAGAFQGSVKWWARGHRIHHRYVDTDKDPYNAKRGFWYSHMGWMIMKQDPKSLGRAEI
jgi:stearoyl-CoA desaturase (delta-9 desaturase)